MIKAKDICKIRNLTKEQLEDIEGQLFNIEMLIDGRRDGELHREVFIDRYINNISVERLIDKYNISRTSLYMILESVNDNITMNRKWKIKMYKNDH